MTSPSTRAAALSRVRRAAATAGRTRTALEDAIVEARHAGHSLRAIADAADISYESVRLILRRVNERS